jgi:hypothetical protein
MAHGSHRQVRFVQFLHPGHEYTSRRIGIGAGQDTALMGWKYGGSRHDRKFLQATGSAIDPTTGQTIRDVDLQFWGEWEPPSRVERLGRGREVWGKPAFLHHPIWPAHAPSNDVGPATGLQGRQNTDPFVFGDRFLYSNCQQGRRVLRNLAVGSIILFGRGSHSRNEFQMDTCLVVGEIDDQKAAPAVENFGIDIAADAVIAALASESASPSIDGEAMGPRPLGTTLYWGETPGPAGLDKPFSFFPAMRAVEGPDAGFVRLPIRPTPNGALQRMVNPAHQQGIRTTVVDRAGQLQEAWDELVDQVRSAGLIMGTHAVPAREDIKPARVV